MTSTANPSTGHPEHVPDFPLPRAARCPFDPPPVLRDLQQDARLRRVRLWNGSTPWLVTRYEDQRTLLGDPRVSADPATPGYPLSSAVVGQTNISFILKDDPEHARLRRMVTGPFAVKRVRAMRPGIQKLTDDLIDSLLAGPQPVDLVAAFALPLPSMVICDLLGVPYEDHDFFQDNSKVLIKRDIDPEERLAASTNLLAYLDDLMGAEIADPGDDLLSGLVGRIEAGELSRNEAAQMGVLLLIAGHETTANMIALGTLALLRHPDQLALLRDSDDPGLVASAVEEPPALPRHHPQRTAPGGPGGHRVRRGDHPGRRGHHRPQRHRQPGRRRVPRPRPPGPHARRPPSRRLRVRGAPVPGPAAGPAGTGGRLRHVVPPYPHPAPGYRPGGHRVQARRIGVRGLPTARGLVTPMRVTVDQDRCVASGQCVMAAAEVFDQRDEDGVVVLLGTEPPVERADDVRHAAAVCPAAAIHVEE